MRAISIYLADLTHRGLILSSNVFPLSIGLIGSYLLSRKPDVKLDLFKYPEDFSTALEARRPDIIGFANYSWNTALNYAYVELIKQLWPETIVIFGGPNYGLEDEEIAEFWRSYPLVDFYVVKEDEVAFADLVEELRAVDMDAAALKASRRELGNCHYHDHGTVVTGPVLPRLEIADVPSPYLSGLMDKFFDEHLAPMIHTTRGCPFKCAFCTEGNAYYNIVSQRLEDLRDELHYIAQRVRGPRDLFVTDANFGMFKQDYEKARLIAECQQQFNFPRTVVVSTGKNQKERVIEISQMLNGALNLAASLQSTDPTVLENVSRSNISLSRLAEVGLLANKVNTGTYSELILGLPGDSVEAHRKSLRDTVEANFENVRMYQLIMLPQTHLNTPEMRRKFSMRTAHRIMPRSFGWYMLAGHKFAAVESEEILTENDTMSFDDYWSCRELDLCVEFLHNGKVFEELQGLCQLVGLPWFDLIERFYERRRDLSPEIAKLFDDFRVGGSSRLWETRKALIDDVVPNLDSLMTNENGTNEMSVGKGTAFFVLLPQLNAALFGLARQWFEEAGVAAIHLSYLDDLERLSYLRKRDLMDLGAEYAIDSSFDLARIEAEKFLLPPEQAELPAPKSFVFAHRPDQQARIAEFVHEFGNTPDGRGKMLMRFPHVNRIFRRVQEAV